MLEELENTEQEAKKSPKKQTDEEILTEAKEVFKDCESADSENRDRALEDLRFGRLGQQWEETVKKQREKEGRPCLTINVMPSNIRQVVNDSRQNKPSIKVHPVDDNADVETAKIIDGLIRNIEANSRADIAYDTAVENACSMNAGYIRVDFDYCRNDSFDLDIKINRVANPLTVYGDPYNPSPDGSAWNYAFVSEMLNEREFARRYPKAKESNFNTDNISDGDQKLWFDDKAIRVAEFWKREEVDVKLLMLSNGEILNEEIYLENQEIFEGAGLEIVKQRPSKSYKITQRIITAKEILETNEWPGIYIPIIPVYGEEVNENGKTHYFSLIHHAKDAQRNKNYWRTCATEQVALASKAPWVGPKGFAKSDPNWDTANTENHSYLEYDGPTEPTRQPFPGVPAGALQEAMNASDDIKSILGLFDASLGAKSNETSGVAINARKREGDTSTFHFIDNLTRSMRQVGAVVLDLIPHVYSEERIMRVLGEDGTPKDVPINQKVVEHKQGYLPAEQAAQQGIKGIEHTFDLTTGKYDLTVSAGPSFNSRREEAAVQMTDFIKSFPESAPVIGDLLAKNLDWPGAEEVAERLKSINPVIQKEEAANQPPPPPPPEVQKIQAQAQFEQQQHQQQMAVADQKAKIDLALKDKDIQLKNKDLELAQLQIQGQIEKNHADVAKSHLNIASTVNQHVNQQQKHNHERESRESEQNFQREVREVGGE